MVRTIQEAGNGDPSGLRGMLHTLKGGAAIFGLESIAEYCHVLETELEDAERTLTIEQCQELDARWTRVRQVVEQFRLEPGINVNRAEHLELVQALEGWAPPALLQRLASWQYEAASGRLALLGKQARALAERLGKGALLIQVEPTELRLPPRRWAPIWMASSHLLRNAVDHGIEPPDERRRLGKPTPTITLGLAHVGSRVVLTVRDDGRGIDWASVAERAREQGLSVDTAEDLEAALFAEGVSSCREVSAISGRGVGLGAVLAVVRRFGGRMHAESAPGEGTTITISLPDAVLGEESFREGAPRQVSLH